MLPDVALDAFVLVSLILRGGVVIGKRGVEVIVADGFVRAIDGFRGPAGVLVRDAVSLEGVVKVRGSGGSVVAIADPQRLLNVGLVDGVEVVLILCLSEDVLGAGMVEAIEFGEAATSGSSGLTATCPMTVSLVYPFRRAYSSPPGLEVYRWSTPWGW